MTFRTRIRAVALAALAAALAVSPAAAKKDQSLHLDAALNSRYDDNILQLSDHQVTDFDSGLHPLRYSLESTDDGVFVPSLALTWELDEGRGRRHALRLRGEGDLHAKNSTADYRAYGARWTESWRRGRRLALGWYRLDNYYVRQLRDEDLPLALGDFRYRRSEFDLQIFSGSWRQDVGKKMNATLAYQFEKRDYVPEFRERTSGTHQGEVRLDWDRLPKRGDVEAHLGYVSSVADATDGDEIAGVKDDDDVSYHGFEGGLDGRMEFSRKGQWRFGGDVEYEVEKRIYDSDLPADRYHYGRDDLMNAVEVGLRLGYRPHWTCRGYYRLEQNTATLGASAPLSSDSGSYRVNQIGLSIGWSGDVWRAGAGASEESGE